MAAAVIGGFSWNTIRDAYWLASAFWYISLVLSILGIMLSAQQVTVLQVLGRLPIQPGHDSHVRRFLPLIMTETQPPLLELGYAWNMETTLEDDFHMAVSNHVYVVLCLLFLAGLTLVVCSPLIKGTTWNTDSNVSLFPIFKSDSLLQ